MPDTPFHIGFVLFPGITQLDFTGPLQVLHRLPGARVHFAAKTLDPLPSDCGLDLVPNTTFDACPQLDLICVPGGFGVDDAMRDHAVTGFVRAQAAQARYVTSVCTGAFVLAAAGLLAGKRATTHWAYHADLETVGAVPVRARVVRDGAVFTGGGVTAGIDFALTIAAEIAGEAVAHAIQLSLEYDPSPPFDSGTPDRAAETIRSGVNARYAPRLAAFREALAEAGFPVPDA